MSDNNQKSENRYRGFLTAGDKQYLRGEDSSLSGNTESQKRYRIRKRVRNTIVDSALVFQHMAQRDRVQITDKHFHRDDRLQLMIEGETLSEGAVETQWDIIETPGDLPYLYTGGLKSMQAFIFLLFHDYFISQKDLSKKMLGCLIANLVEAGIQDAFGKKGDIIDATVDITIDDIDIDPEILCREFDRGYDRVTDQEVEWLFQLRKINFEDQKQYRRVTRSDESLLPLMRRW